MDKKGLLGMLFYFSIVGISILMAWFIANYITAA